MQELYSLIHSLTCSEWASLQNYLTSFTAHDASRLKYLDLAKILMGAAECPSDSFCRIKIYGTKEEDICFDVLKSRLKDKVLDFLLTDISCDKKKELDEADYAIIKIKKKSAQFQQLYYSKKRTQLLYGLLDEIILLAKEYEQYSNLVEHLRLKKALVSWKRSSEEFEKINMEMKYAWQCSGILNKSEHYYSELMMLNDYSSKSDKQITFSFLKKSIAEVREGYEFTKSPMINYYLKNLEMGFYHLHENYSKARSVCLELLGVVRSNKSVYRRQRVGVVYDNLSRCEYYLSHFKQAAEWAREAQKHFNLNSENYCIALEQEFYALFAMEQYTHATDIANKILSSASPKELGEFRDSKYHYLLANALFKQQRFREALNLLSTERELAKDKAGWEIGARVLHIMTLIEMGLLDEASLAVSNLKRFYSRTDKETPISPRDKKILNLLLIAERKGFMFNLLNGSADKYMNALQGTNDELRVTKDKETTGNSSLETRNLKWEPFTHEVIPFHEWFAGKLGKRKIKVVEKKELPEKNPRERRSTLRTSTPLI